jgi:hypothetical protein
MSTQIRIAAAALLCAVGLSILAPEAAMASKAGRRNTAIGLGAVAAYGVIKKKPLVAGVAGGAALYSYTRSRQSTKRRPRRRVVATRRSHRSAYYCRKHHKLNHPCAG